MDSSAFDFIRQLRQAFMADDENISLKGLEETRLMQLQEIYGMIVQGDFIGFANALDEDVIMETIGPASIPFVGRWCGRVQVAEATRRNFEWLEGQRLELLNVTAQGDTVIVIAREEGRYRPTGMGYNIHWVQQLTFRGRKLSRFRQIFDSAAMLEAVNSANRGFR